MSIPPIPEIPDWDENELKALQPMDRSSPEWQTKVKAANAAKLENALGPLRPLGQFWNMLGSGSSNNLGAMVAGPINGISQLINAAGDKFQGKDIDVSDAPVIPNSFINRFDIQRYTHRGYRETSSPNEEAGTETAKVIGAELTGGAILQGAKWGLRALTARQGATKLPLSLQVLQKAQGGQAVRNLAVRTAAGNTGAARRLQFASNLAEGLASTSIATAFTDNRAEEGAGNLANLPQLWGGQPIPGLSVSPTDDYLTSTFKTLGVDGFLAPLGLASIGFTSPALRKSMGQGDTLQVLTDLGDAKLSKYTMKTPLPALPPAQGTQFPEYRAPSKEILTPPPVQGPDPMQGPKPFGAIVPYDSAISRSTSEQLQILQVNQQRDRLMQMGLVEEGRGGQFELTMDGVVDPEVKLQIRELQAKRGQLIAAGADEAALGEINQQIDDLTLNGESNLGRFVDFMGPRPDGRPELDTFLAELDEMDDAVLTRLADQVNEPAAMARRQQKLDEAQGQLDAANEQVDVLQQQMAELETKKLTELGKKRKLNKYTKDLAAQQERIAQLEQEVLTAQGQIEGVGPKLVGDQMALELEYGKPGQQELDLTEKPQPIELPQMEQFEWDEAGEMFRLKGREKLGSMEGGYKTMEAYRDELMGFPRDLLRQMANPTNSPEIAALVKARTGRRVYSAKKADIVEAYVEIADKRGRFVPQLSLALGEYGQQGELFGIGESMTAARRERLKQEILEAAIANGEVQPPRTAIPTRPNTEFDQTTLVDQLLDDSDFAAAYADDQIPTYEASGRGLEDRLEEIRQRFNYEALDGQAREVQRQAVLQKAGWDKLSFDQKMQSGLLDLDAYTTYRLKGSELVRPAEPYAVPKGISSTKTDTAFVRDADAQTPVVRTERAKPITEGARSDLDLKEPKKPAKPQRYFYEGGKLIPKDDVYQGAGRPSSPFRFTWEERSPLRPQGPAEAPAAGVKQPTASELNKKLADDAAFADKQEKLQIKKVEREANQRMRIGKEQLAAIDRRIEELRKQSAGRSC